jgi:predicted membrane protein
MKVNKLFDNIYLLYLVSFLAIINILGYIIRNSAYSLVFFAVVTFVIYYILPHWTVALIMAILLTNIFVPGRHNHKREGMKNKEEREKVTPEKVSKNPRVDYASTVEGAYKDLSKILGSEGIQNLTTDTKQLMSQQMELAKAMEGMAPLLHSAKSMLDGFDMKNLGGLSDIAKQLTTK